MGVSLYAQTVVPGFSQSQGAVATSATGEGRIIVLVFLGVCALIAVHQLVPALKKLFKVAGETAAEKKIPSDRN